MKDLDKNKKYMVAVSGGADSMSLLDKAYKLGLNIVVGHVNYKKRPTADRDQHIVEDYCKQRNIPLFVRIAKHYEEGNFQDNARIERYQFFNEIMKKEHIETLLVAHQLDDALETYLFKKKRNSYGESLSILKESEAFGIHIYRPLLNYYRSDLRQYCLDNNITFGDDESNFTLDYERNRIRILVLGNLSRAEKDKLVLQMNKDNELWSQKNKKVDEFYNKNVVDKHFNYEAYKSLDKSLSNLFLYRFLENNLHQSISLRRIYDIKKQLDSKPNVSLNIKGMVLTRAYSDVYLHTKNEVKDYFYTINKIEELKTPYFTIGFSGKTNYGIYVDEKDFPLTIRNYKNGDFVRMKDYNKDVKRLFIDRKISKDKRNTIPMVLNKDNEIILIPGIYRIYERKLLRSNIFVL